MKSTDDSSVSSPAPAAEFARAELRVLVRAPTGRDAQLIASLLRHAGIVADIIVSLAEVEEDIQNGAGAFLISEEAISCEEIDRLRGFLKRQPSWSDFPLILLTKAGRVSTATMRSTEHYQALGNVLLLERPIRPETLISTVQRMLQTRRRQYQIRDYLCQQSRAEAALRETEKLAVTGRLAATIAHEINNPLASVTNLLFLLRSHVRDEGVRYLSIAETELERIAAITRQTLAFYHDNGKPENVSLPALLDEILRLLTPKLSQGHIAVQRHYVEVEVRGLKGELRQLFLNLIDNAISATPIHGAVKIVVTAEPSSACVSITDSGSGISSENLEKIFEPFFTTKAFGTGLGLWVARDVAAKHGGGIRVESQTEGELRGASFHVTLAKSNDLYDKKMESR